VITDSLDALSPLDGRYAHQTSTLASYFSEFALISHRVKIEILYLQKISQFGVCRPLKPLEKKLLNDLLTITKKDALAIKKIEAKTHHDVKAIEYFLQKKFKNSSLNDLIPFIHFGLTSEDVNNLSYRWMVSQAVHELILPELKLVLAKINSLSQEHAKLVILARTHGQAAVPTTLGKEFSVFGSRLLTQLQKLEKIKLQGKLNGAVGGYQSFVFAHPKINWLKLSQNFVTSLDLNWRANTTQIAPADDLVELFNHLHLINSILIGLNQDIWRYISDDWLVQKGKLDKVGSSTMPQKINPIEFENSEGNLVMANGFYETLSRKLPICRLQRDLSDSTVLRNIGSAFGYNLIAFNSLIRGLNTIDINFEVISKALHQNWNILSEAINVELRTQNQVKAYEQAASQMKNKKITQSDWQNITKTLSKKLMILTPETYLGKTVAITQSSVNLINKYLNRKARS